MAIAFIVIGMLECIGAVLAVTIGHHWYTKVTIPASRGAKPGGSTRTTRT